MRRYDQIIGSAKQAIAPGQHVHTHNLEFSSFARDYAAASGAQADRSTSPTPATFDGIVRADGRIATRNYIGILTSVNCSATVARAIADHFRRDTNPQALERFPNVDGVVALTHGAGCATDSAGEPLQVLRRTLGGYARHPNFAAVLVVGLGCETNQISGLMEQESLRRPAPRCTPSTSRTPAARAKTVAHGIELVEWLLEEANQVTRTAGAGEPHHGRPAVRRLRRLLGHQRQPGARRRGRSAGAPRRHRDPVGDARDLRRRAPADAPRGVAARSADKLVARIRWWERLHASATTRRDGQQPVGRQQGRRPDDDPREEPGRDRQERHDQPGRRRRVRRSRSPRKGLVFMDTPGYDPVSATGQVAGGANLICFTTGRGSAYGCAPSPSLKLVDQHRAVAASRKTTSTSTAATSSTARPASTRWASASSALMLATASGTKTKSEVHGYGQNEFVPWSLGAVM